MSLYRLEERSDAIELPYSVWRQHLTSLVYLSYRSGSVIFLRTLIFLFVVSALSGFHSFLLFLRYLIHSLLCCSHVVGANSNGLDSRLKHDEWQDTSNRGSTGSHPAELDCWMTETNRNGNNGLPVCWIDKIKTPSRWRCVILLFFCQNSSKYVLLPRKSLSISLLAHLINFSSLGM